MKSKKELGAFYTTNVDHILSGYEHYVGGKNVVDFAVGDGDLTKWAENNGAQSITGFDINPEAKGLSSKDHVKDTILESLDTEGKFILMNPPYLARNKTKNKEPFDKHGVNDLYKASIMNLIKHGAEEGILIVPSNIFFDEDVEFRKKLYSTWEIKDVIIFDTAVFEDTTVRVTSFYFKKGSTNSLEGKPLDTSPEGKLRPGKEWYSFIQQPTDVKIERLLLEKSPSEGMFITNIKLFATDTGTEEGRIHCEVAPLYYGKGTDRNFATIVSSVPLTEEEQKEVCKDFKESLEYFRNKYKSCFLTNFLASKTTERKRISFSSAYKLLSVIIKEKADAKLT